MYQTILVPLDGSQRAERILPHVESLAGGLNSTLILVRIVQTAIVTEGYKSISIQDSLAATQHDIHEAEKYLSDQASRMLKAGLNVRNIVRTGPVVETILDVATKESVDLIAMASHGRSGVGRVFYGSIAAGVLQRIDRPILVIRSRDR